MNKIEHLIAEGKITPEDLINANELIERAKLAANGIEACKKTLKFPFGASSIECYSFTDAAGEYHSWGNCTYDGVFTCYCNWGGDHQVGQCNLFSFADVFEALGKPEFSNILKSFFKQQINKTK